jgi:hypothetical protein
MWTVKRVFEDPAFVGEARCRWQALRAPGAPLDVANIDAKIAAFAGEIAAAKRRDEARWGTVGKYVWPNNYVGATWSDEVTYLRAWIRRRLAWLDANLPGSCAGEPTPPAVAPLSYPAPVALPRRTPEPGLPMQTPAFVPPEGTPTDASLASYACPK